MFGTLIAIVMFVGIAYMIYRNIQAKRKRVVTPVNFPPGSGSEPDNSGNIGGGFGGRGRPYEPTTQDPEERDNRN